MDKTKEEQERNKRNKDLVQRFKRGESLASVPPEATWFPPRPNLTPHIKRRQEEDNNNKKDNVLTIDFKKQEK